MSTIEQVELALEDFFANVSNEELNALVEEIDALENDEGVTLEDYVNNFEKEYAFLNDEIFAIKTINEIN